MNTLFHGRIATLLAWIGGSVDAVGYLMMYHLFVAHMSGNSAALGVGVGTGNADEMTRRGAAVALFLVGIALGAIVNEWLERRRVERRFAVEMGLEFALVGAFAIWGGAVASGGAIPRDPAWRFFLIAALPLLAMGLQNAILYRVGNASIHTTFVTGILMSLTESLVKCGFAAMERKGKDGFPARLRAVWRSLDARNTRLYASIYIAYISGAVTAAWLQTEVGPWSLIPALIGLVAAILADLRRPVRPDAPGTVEAG
jgi:uncharacterized membrane protein YoaK (UPF0700 family)